MTFCLQNSFKLSLGKRLLKVNLLESYQLPQQGLKTTRVIFCLKKPHSDASKSNETSKKRKESFKITLLQNQNMTVTGLEDAKNLAKRRSMHLVKVQDIDAKTQRPVYKLLTAADLLQDQHFEIKKPKADNSANIASKNSEKSLSIGSRIAEHDLSSRLKIISKWLTKQHEVKILIQATSEKDLPNAERIYKAIEESIKVPQVIGRILQKRSKPNGIKFSIGPVKANQENPVSSTQ